MGKRLLVGWIGLFGVGVFMTGCDCCNKQSRQQSFAGGKADSNMGVSSRAATGWNDKATSGSQPLSSAGSGSTFNSSSGGTGQSVNTGAGGGAPWGDSSSNGMGGVPAKSSVMPAMNSGNQPPVGSTYQSPRSMTTPPSADSLLNGGASPSMVDAQASGDSTNGAGIQQTSHHSGDSTSNTPAGFHSVDGGSPSTMGMNDSASQLSVPPPPSLPSSMTGSSSSKSTVSDLNASLPPLPSASSSALPPQEPPSTSDAAALGAAPPTVNAATVPPISGSTKAAPAAYAPWNH